MTLVFMYPGQSSRYPEMFDKLIALHEPNKGLMVQASEALGRDLIDWYRPGNDKMYESNRDVQIGVFLANHLYTHALESRGVRAEMSLGLSLGEYSHLVHIGALEFRDALRLVQKRGELYDGGPDGMMVSVFPLEIDALREVVERVRDLGIIEIANQNSPRQQVLSGDRAPVEAAIKILEDEMFLEPVIIEQKIPMHSTRFAPVSAAFRAELERAPWRAPRKPYLPNVLGRVVPDPKAADFVDLLSRHVSQPVLWRQSIEFIAQAHPGVRFVEVGPRGVLYNLLEKKWLKLPRFKTDSAENHGETFAGVVQELSNAA